MEYRGRVFDASGDTESKLRTIARCLTTPSPKFGIILCGVCGNGKTTTLKALQSAINFLNANKMFEENTGMPIVPARDIAAVVKDTKMFNLYCQRPLLAVDDMGREPAEILEYGNILNPVSDLIEYRYNALLFTVIATNLTPKQITEKYGRRIADRFNEMLHVLIYEHETYRKPNKTESETPQNEPVTPSKVE